MAYFLSPALARLRLEVNTLWPNRSKVSDGWIGDTSHAARKSDHNPDYSAGGIVRAIDVTNSGINVDAFIAAVIRDPRTRYVISRGRIWTRDRGWHTYYGSNGHYAHVHVSVRSVSEYDLQLHSWGLATSVANDTGGTGGVTVPNLPGAPAPITPEEDLPLNDDDLIKILTAKFDITQDGVTRKVSLKDALAAVYFYGDHLSGEVKATPARTWDVRFPHSVTGAETRAADFLRYVPAEHVATRKVTESVVAAIPGVDARAVQDAVTQALKGAKITFTVED